MEQTHTKHKNTSIGSMESITIDARGKKLGRLASETARLLMGKQSPSFERNILSRAKIVVANAAQMDISVRKIKEKRYARYSGYPGGLRYERIPEIVAKKGVTELLRRAVHGMLPANKLRTLRMKNLVIRE